MPLLAQAAGDAQVAVPWFDTFAHMGLWAFFAIAAVCAAATVIVRRVLQHRENMAMIQAGMNPNENLAAMQE